MKVSDFTFKQPDLHALYIAQKARVYEFSLQRWALYKREGSTKRPLESVINMWNDEFSSEWNLSHAYPREKFFIRAFNAVKLAKERYEHAGGRIHWIQNEN